MDCPSFNEWIEQSIKEHWDLDALTDYGTHTYKYKDACTVCGT